MDELQISLSSY